MTYDNMTVILNEDDYEDALNEAKYLLETGRDNDRLSEIGLMIAEWEDEEMM